MARMSLVQEYKLLLTTESIEELDMLIGDLTRQRLQRFVEAFKIYDRVNCSMYSLGRTIGIAPNNATRHLEAYHEAVRQLKEGC